MPDYNLGRAHGTIKIDYDGSGVDEAEKGIEGVGESAEETSRKIDKSTDEATKAYQRLGRETKRNKPELDVDEDGFRRFLTHLQNIQKNTSRSSSILNTFSGRTKLLGGAIAIATPQVASLGVALASLSGLAGVAAGALASLASVGTTLATGLNGIGDAFKAAAQQTAAAGSSAKAAAKAQRSAARAIEDAKRSLADAEENLRRTQEDAARAAIQAARDVLDAQRDLVNAQRDARRAQEDLNKARRDAVRDLEDMRDALIGGSLDERQAVLDLAEAQEELARVRRDPTANADDIAQAVLNYDKAAFALERVRKENQRLAVDQASAASAGVAGSEQVVNAQESVRGAMESVRDAQQALADAQENVRQTQVDSARAIADASQAVIDAQRNLAEAYEDAADAGDAGGAAADKFAEAMAHLSPNAQAFVREVLAMGDAWSAVRRNVQDELFAGLAQEVRPLAQQWFPLLEEGMRDVARGLNGMIHETIEYLKTTEAQENVANIFSNTGLALQEMRGWLRDVLAAFLDIASVGSDLLPDMAEGAADAAARFRDFVSAAKESGELRQWMQDGIDTANALWEVLKNIGSIIGTIFTTLDNSGGGALVTFAELTQRVEDFLKSAEGQEALESLGAILRSIGGAYGDVFLSFLDVAAQLLVTLEPLITAFADAAGTYLAAALQALGYVLQPIADVLGFLGPALGPVIAGIYAANKAVDAAKTAWSALNTVMRGNPFILIASLVIALAYLIITNWEDVKNGLAAAWEWIKTTAETVWNAIADFFRGIWEDITGQVTAAWDGITSFVTTAWDRIKNLARTAWNAIKDFIVNAVTNAGTGVRDGLAKVGRFFQELPGKILDFLKSLPGKLADWAGDLIEGIIRGIGNLAYKVYDKLRSMISDAWDGVLSFLGISSPSKLAMEAGEFVSLGLAEGIANAASAAVNAASNMAQAVGSELTGASGSLATTLSVGADTSGVPTELGMSAALAGASRTAVSPDAGGKNVVIHVGNLTLQVAGNLDPTNPTAFRQTIVRLKTAILNVEKEYA